MGMPGASGEKGTTGLPGLPVRNGVKPQSSPDVKNKTIFHKDLPAQGVNGVKGDKGDSGLPGSQGPSVRKSNLNVL